MSNNESDNQEIDELQKATPKKKDKRAKLFSRRKRRQPPPMWKIIDKVFAQSVGIAVNQKSEKSTVFEAINQVLDQELGKGRRKALKIKRKYETYAKAHPKVIVHAHDDEELAEIYREFCRTGRHPGQKPPSKAELEEAREWQNLSHEDAAEIYQASLKREN
jgi:hypothetical protein